LAQRLATMTHPDLFGGVQFGGTTPEAGIKKHWVITKTLLASRGVQHDTWPAAGGDHRHRVEGMSKQDDNTVKACSSGRLIHPCQSRQQFGVVVAVTGINASVTG
jgi:hypothetical protein